MLEKPQKRAKTTKTTYNYKPRLHTPEQVTDEKRKLFRDFKNKRITRAEYEGQLKGLDSIHNGMLKQGDNGNANPDYVPPIINIARAASGQQLMPGGQVLAPFEEAGRAWTAFKAYTHPHETPPEPGAEHPWQIYLRETKSIWTQESIDHLSVQVPPEPGSYASDDNNVTPLRLISDETESNPQLSALESKLLAMTHDELLQLAEAFNVGK